MMQRVQLSIADSRYAAAVREALARSCAWNVETAILPELPADCVVVLDEASFERLPLPLANPERVVLITRKDPQTLAEAWEAGIVSVVSDSDPVSTVLLAIMAAALRLPHSAGAAKTNTSSGISPKTGVLSAPLAPPNQINTSKRSKIL